MSTSPERTNGQQSPTQRAVNTGKGVVEELQRLVAEGNARRLHVERQGRTVLEIPLSVGVVGAVLAPHVAGLGAIAALVTGCSMRVERPDSEPEQRPSEGEPAAEA